jgi:hypothetical protein
VTLTTDRLVRDVVERARRSLQTPFDVTLEWMLVPPDFLKPDASTTPEALRAVVGAEAWRRVEGAWLDSRGAGWGVPILAVPVDAISTADVIALDEARWKRVPVERIWPGTGRADESLEDRARLIAQRAGGRVWTLTASAQWGFLFPMALTSRVRHTVPTTRWPAPTAP